MGYCICYTAGILSCVPSVVRVHVLASALEYRSVVPLGRRSSRRAHGSLRDGVANHVRQHGFERLGLSVRLDVSSVAVRVLDVVDFVGFGVWDDRLRGGVCGRDFAVDGGRSLRGQPLGCGCGSCDAPRRPDAHQAERVAEQFRHTVMKFTYGTRK